MEGRTLRPPRRHSFHLNFPDDHFSDLAFRAAAVMRPGLIRAAFNVAKLDSSAKIRLHYRAIVTRAMIRPGPFPTTPRSNTQ
jgi:hypothetical protein